MSKDINSRKVANIMGLLSNEIRIDILKLVYTEPRSFSDLLKHLSLESTSKLSFHLKKMEQLIEKQDIDGLYELTDAGLEVYNLISAFEDGSLLKNIVVEQSIPSWETIKRFLLERSGALFITLIIGITLGVLLISIPVIIISDIIDKILGISFLFEISRYIPYFSFYLGPVVGAILYVFIKWRQWKEDS
ncbi:MAG: ArsR/SmtB family transcription factor [Candidatus Hermodarchaeota archaeon]